MTEAGFKESLTGLSQSHLYMSK